MGNTFNGYANYGCLAAEKRTVFTGINPNPTATVSDPVEYTVPEGWTVGENYAGDPIITAPWGWDYDPNELLWGDEKPYFNGFDKDGKRFRIALEWREL